MIEITKRQIREIAKSIPISYYIKQKVAINFDDCDTSYYNFSTNTITFSYKNVYESLEHIKDMQDINKLIRIIIFHELAHILLSNKRLIEYYNINHSLYCFSANFINMIEDTRIEKLAENYFIDCDFSYLKETLFAYFKPEHMVSPETALFGYLRLGYPLDKIKDEEKLDIVKEYLKDIFFGISAEYSLETIFEKMNILYMYLANYYKQSDLNSYNNSTNEKYSSEDKFKNNTDENFLQDNNIEKYENNSNKSDVNQLNEFDKNTNNELTENLDNDLISNADNLDENATGITTNYKNNSLEEFDKSIHNFYTPYNRFINNLDIKIKQSTSLLQQFESIFKKHDIDYSAGSYNTYSGYFNYRNLRRDDYKYFSRLHDKNYSKFFKKINLNLFIDCSGSMKPSEIKLNCLMTTLKYLSNMKNYIDINFIHIGMTEYIMNDFIYCEGANDITENLTIIFKKLQKVNCNNYNIVLTDGDLLSSHKNFFENHLTADLLETKLDILSILDNKSVLILTDTENIEYFQHFKRAAIKIIPGNNEDYAEIFISELLKSLNYMLK